jgi:phosphoribosylamine--glycine ligase
MMRLKSDLLEVMLATVDGKLDQIDMQWDPRPAICVVATSKGYPASSQSDVPISGIEQADAMSDVKVFHSGTAMKDGRLVTAGGRVLGVTAIGDDITAARQKAYDAMAKIQFDGMHYRRDIAHQAVR